MMSFFINLNNDKDFWDILEIIFSIASFFATIYIGIKANEISKNSLRPYLSIVLGDYTNHLYIKITNSGLDPGVIKEIKFEYKQNITYSLINLIDIIKQDIQIEDKWVTFTEEIKNRAIAPNHELIVLEKKALNSRIEQEKNMGTNNIDNYEFKQLKKALSKVKITIKYINILRPKKILETNRKLKFFIRKINIQENKFNNEEFN